jgi:putative two-component system response regulator
MDALVAMSREEVERTMRTLEPMYDLVRLVDPSTMEGASLDERGELAMPHRCFDVLCKGRRCQNCISARTVASKGSVSKFEFVGDDAFYISTRYVEVDGEPRSIELVKKIGDQVVIDP